MTTAEISALELEELGARAAFEADFRTNDDWGAPDVRTRSLTGLTERFGSPARMSTAAPETIGVAIDVPSKRQ